MFYRSASEKRRSLGGFHQELLRSVGVVYSNCNSTFFNPHVSFSSRSTLTTSTPTLSDLSGQGGGRSLRFQRFESSAHKHGCSPPRRHRGLWAVALLQLLSPRRCFVQQDYRTVHHLESTKIPGIIHTCPIFACKEKYCASLLLHFSEHTLFREA